MIDDWCEGIGRPSLAQLLNFCWVIGASVTDLLDSDELIILARLEEMEQQCDKIPLT